MLQGPRLERKIKLIYQEWYTIYDLFVKKYNIQEIVILKIICCCNHYYYNYASAQLIPHKLTYTQTQTTEHVHKQQLMQIQRKNVNIKCNSCTHYRPVEAVETLTETCWTLRLSSCDVGVLTIYYVS